MDPKRLLKLEWDAIAGVVAGVAAIVLELFHVADPAVLLTILSFWGEPFMSRATELQVPRYIFRVQRHSELIARLSELERQYRMGPGSSGGA